MGKVAVDADMIASARAAILRIVAVSFAGLRIFSRAACARDEARYTGISFTLL